MLKKKYLSFLFANLISMQAYSEEITFESNVSKVCGFEYVDSTSVIFNGLKGRAAKIIAINNDKEIKTIPISVSFVSYRIDGIEEMLSTKYGKSLFDIEISSHEIGFKSLYDIKALEDNEIKFPVRFDNAKRRNLYKNTP